MMAVGVSSTNESGLSAAINSMPRPRNIRCPVSCTMRSRAKRFAVSTRMVRALGIKRLAALIEEALGGQLPTDPLQAAPRDGRASLWDYQGPDGSHALPDENAVKGRCRDGVTRPGLQSYPGDEYRRRQAVDGRHQGVRVPG